MKDMIFEDFQSIVSDMLLRHRSILDLLTKYQESSAKVNRSIIKSVTSCGCIKVEGHKQEMPEDISFENMKNYMNTQIKGTLCKSCQDAIGKELGNHLFYLAGIANALDISLYDIVAKEEKKLAALGVYHYR